MSEYQQPSLEGMIPGSYWIEVRGHPTIDDGERFLIVGEQGVWLVGWRDGVKPLGKGTFIHPKHARKIEEGAT